MVIGLQSTGEANTVAVKELIGDSMDDFVSAPQQILLGWLNNHFPKGHCGMADAKIYSLYSQVSTIQESLVHLLHCQSSCCLALYSTFNEDLLPCSEVMLIMLVHCLRLPSSD